MKIWKVKALVQKVISFLPFRFKINFLFQKYITKGVLLTDALMEDKLTHCKNHLHYFFKYRPASNNFKTLEIGTGWYPIVPLSLYLSGAAEVFSVDLSPLLQTSAVHDTIKKLLQYQNEGKLKDYLPGIIPERLKKAEELLGIQLPASELLAKLNIHIIVGDARSTGFASATFDLINSNNTFEHIYPEILAAILAEFKRIIKPDGIMSHQIDMSDHFAHLDKSITIYNFLQYSDREWDMIDNSVQPQNRLRISDYRDLFQQAGFTILEELNRPGNGSELSQVQLAEKYKSYQQKDLRVSHSLLIAEPHT